MSNPTKVTPKFHRNIGYALIIALVAAVLLLQNYFGVVVVSVLFAYLYYPIFKKLNKKMSANSAASLTLVINLLSLIIPVILVLLITVSQARVIVRDVGGYFTGQSATDFTSAIITPINDTLESITGDQDVVTAEELYSRLAKYATNFASFVLNIVTGWVSGIGSLITQTILYIYLFLAVLKYGEKLEEVMKTINPLGDSVSNLYLEKAGAMTKGMVRGQFVIAITQGIASAIILWATGVPYFAFFALLLSFMSLIPLGAGILTIPIGVVRILLGDWWQGIVIILGHLLVVTNIDNIMRPYLVPKKAFMNPALLMLSVFAGMSTFGFLGIVIGPVIMALIVATIDIYLLSKQPEAKATK